MGSLWHLLGPGRDMDFEDDGLDPWDRDEFEEPLDGPCGFDEHEMGPPEEIFHDVPQAQPDQEPTALEHPCGCESMKKESDEPRPPAELPILEASDSPTKRKADSEPTAQVVRQLVATRLPKQKKLRRLSTKTSVPRHVCPPQSLTRWDEVKLKVEEDFVSPAFFYKLDGKQKYNWVYERVRSFFVRSLLPTSLTEEKRLNFWR